MQGTSATISEAEQSRQALSTLNEDGSRRWLRPRLSRGRFLLRRRAVAYGLIAIFTLIPYLRMNGKPLVLLDVPRREFTIFGATFLPTDTLLLSLLMIGIFLLIFVLTALLGRVWCGWACPQTVYMEFLFRPIERLFEGEPGKVRRRVGGGRKLLKWIAYTLVSMFLAHTFLAYFVGVEKLLEWVQRSPLEHPASFLIMISVTALMLFDFGCFREQMCVVACPYGRFQSVMLDRDTLIIGYNTGRGEPRGKAKRRSGGNVALPLVDAADTASGAVGDCVDCRLCVQTCPTGIDIREGLQMECIGCAQCIDACDAVMSKLGRERGLIRYSSQNVMTGKARRLLRPRIVIYPVALVVVTSLFVAVLLGSSPADVKVLRGPGMPFNVLPSGEVANQVRIKITNRSPEDASYTIAAVAEAVTLLIDENPMLVKSGAHRTQSALLVAPAGLFKDGRFDATVRITDGQGFSIDTTYRLLGPTASRNSEGEAP